MEQDLPCKLSFTTTVYHPRVPEGTGAAYNVQTAEAWHSFSPFQKLPHSVRFSYLHHTHFGHLCLESTQQKSPFHTHTKILTSTYPKTKPCYTHRLIHHYSRCRCNDMAINFLTLLPMKDGTFHPFESGHAV